MTISNEDIRALNALFLHHVSYWLDTAHADGIAIRKNSGCIKSGTDITRLLSGLWNDVGYSTLSLYYTNTEHLRVRRAVRDGFAVFEMAYTYTRKDGTNYSKDVLIETADIRTYRSRQLCRTKKINLLALMLHAFNEQRIPVQYRGTVALIR